MMAAQGIQERGGRAMCADERANALGFIEEREDVSVRKQAAEAFDNPFAAPHAQQPVMNDGGAPAIAAGCTESSVYDGVLGGVSRGFAGEAEAEFDVYWLGSGVIRPDAPFPSRP
jgi:hypothetical protein